MNNGKTPPLLKTYQRLLIVLAVTLMSVTIVEAQNSLGRYHVNSLAYSPDGLKIAVGGGSPICSDDPNNASKYEIRILDATTGGLLDTIPGHTCAIWAIAWSPDGTKIATTSDDGTSRTWNVSTKQEVSRYAGSASDSFIRGLAWSPDGQKIAIFRGTEVIIWNVSTGAILKVLNDEGDYSTVNSVRWKPDNSQIATAATDQDAQGAKSTKVEIWDVTSSGNQGQLIRKLDVGFVYAVAWSPDGSKLAGGGFDGTLRTFDPMGQILTTFAGNTGGIETVVWSLDGTRIASGGADNAARVWNAASGQQLSVYNHSGFVAAIAWNPNGTTIAYGGQSSDPNISVQIGTSPPISSSNTDLFCQPDDKGNLLSQTQLNK